MWRKRKREARLSSERKGAAAFTAAQLFAWGRGLWGKRVTPGPSAFLPRVWEWGESNATTLPSKKARRQAEPPTQSSVGLKGGQKEEPHSLFLYSLPNPNPGQQRQCFSFSCHGLGLEGDQWEKMPHCLSFCQPITLSKRRNAWLLGAKRKESNSAPPLALPISPGKSTISSNATICRLASGGRWPPLLSLWMARGRRESISTPMWCHCPWINNIADHQAAW